MPINTDLLNVGLIGAGFIGRLHAINLSRSDKVNLRYVCDTDAEKGEQVAQLASAEFIQDPERIFTDREIDVVWIASPASTHCDLILRSARSGKAVFCEKPIASNLDDARRLLDDIGEEHPPIVIGFNRRFDPTHKSLKRQVDEGRIGKVELVQITSRDPNPPPVEYMKATPGGVFYDTMIHDMDIACWLLGEMPTEVYATAHQMIDGPLNPIGDLDTATATLTTKSGKVCQINVSRRSAYGYDQRIEVFGSKGMLQSTNQTPTTLIFSGKSGVESDPLKNFFIDRYEQSYLAEIEDVYHVVNGTQKNYPGLLSGYHALVLSFAALEAAKTGSIQSL